jgi:membrane-associated PAP2 superfamily phosphatase
LGKKTLWLSIASLILILVFFEYSNADLVVQNYFYSRADKSWLLNDPTGIYRLIFYKGIKFPLYALGIGTLIASIVTWKHHHWKERRKGLLIVTLTLIILPSTIATIGKYSTNVQCPYDIKEFNGQIPYVKLFEKYPLNPNSPDGTWPRGKCFPAGHASGGFALFSLVCLVRKRKNKILLFLFAFIYGWTMAVYQMLRGAHFISHHLTTIFLSLILVSTLNLLIKDYSNESIES